MEYDVVIGLETHVELNTKTKVFCSCKNEFGGEPNTHCCPICIGLPGVLPNLNMEAVKKAIKIGIATNCEITREFYFDRKHYFYPDLAKAYQISQDNTPICRNGYIEVTGKDGNLKKVRIRQIHLEEDSGKLIHSASGETYVDYNRGGVPLIEIVSHPDLSSVEEAIEYVTYIKDLVKHIGISDCKMEQGSLRCDVNVSLKEKGATEYGVKVEMKNLNSFKAIERAIKYEVNRQKEILNAGGVIIPETLRWDDNLNKNFSMRSKEEAKDYRYMPEPDIPLTVISDSMLDEIKREMPLLPREIKAKLKNEYGLNDYDASLISKDAEITKFFYGVSEHYKTYKKIANWITSEINKKLNLELVEEIVVPLNAVEFAKVLTYLDAGTISQMGARTLLNELWGKEAETTDNLIQKLNLKLENNDADLDNVVKGVIDANPKALSDYKEGKNKNAFTFFMGQVMKATRGQADAGKVNSLLNKYLNE